MSRFRTACVLVAFGWLAATSPQLAASDPYRPQQDSHILERLTTKPADRLSRDLTAWRAHLPGTPPNLDTAVALATRLIERARSDGDPRLLGQAQAVVSHWWNQPAPPPAVLLLRATIRQNAHEFDLALADLDALLSQQPATAQAWLTKAAILQVQGRYDEARRACQPLLRLAGRHIGQTCLSEIAGLTGHARDSRIQLLASLARPGIPQQERLWILTALAEVTARTGDHQQAEPYFLDALQLGLEDQYLINAYADFLLDHDRAQEVIALIHGNSTPDGLLLRLALAEQRLRDPAAPRHIAELVARFAAGRARGSRVHLREEARFTLDLLHEPAAALVLAQDNWGVQKEPWDARLLLASAVAAGNDLAAKPVLDWLATHHLEDRHLQPLAARAAARLPEAFPKGTR